MKYVTVAEVIVFWILWCSEHTNISSILTKESKNLLPPLQNNPKIQVVGVFNNLFIERIYCDWNKWPTCRSKLMVRMPYIPDAPTSEQVIAISWGLAALLSAWFCRIKITEICNNTLETRITEKRNRVTEKLKITD